MPLSLDLKDRGLPWPGGRPGGSPEGNSEAEAGVWDRHPLLGQSVLPGCELGTEVGSGVAIRDSFNN